MKKDKDRARENAMREMKAKKSMWMEQRQRALANGGERERESGREQQRERATPTSSSASYRTPTRTQGNGGSERGGGSAYGSGGGGYEGQGSVDSLAASASLGASDPNLTHLLSTLSTQIKEEMRHEFGSSQGTRSGSGGGGSDIVLSCPVCQCMYMRGRGSDPVTLFPCGHSLCKGCLKDISKDRRPICPLCRTGIDSSADSVVL
ncbi:hypothetical protein KIPB_011913, partial [Kipferlia bialata]|eukprot:g11913.t1